MNIMEIKLDIKSDKNNESKAVIVFSEDKPSEVFEALKKAEKQIETKLKQGGIITQEGYAPAEYSQYAKIIEKLEKIDKDAKEFLAREREITDRVKLKSETEKAIDLVESSIETLLESFK